MRALRRTATIVAAVMLPGAMLTTTATAAHLASVSPRTSTASSTASPSAPPAPSPGHRTPGPRSETPRPKMTAKNCLTVLDPVQPGQRFSRVVSRTCGQRAEKALAEAQQARTLLLKVYEHEQLRGNWEVYSSSGGSCDASGYGIRDLGYTASTTTTSFVMYNNCTKVTAYQATDFRGLSEDYYGDRVVNVGLKMNDRISSAWLKNAPRKLPPGETVAVAMGDSYISGEGGRWNGNSPTGDLTRNGSDRATTCTILSCDYDPARIYGGTTADGGNGCHRSDTAEIEGRSSGIPVTTRINLACSGAETAHVRNTTFKGEPPQVDQLANIAAQAQVKYIVLSIGGNDLDFTGIITDCVRRYVVGLGPCNGLHQPNIDRKLAGVRANIAASIADIRAAMGAQSGYRIILQSYPSPLPRGSESRFPASADSLRRGCPFHGADEDWARDRLIPQISESLRQVARENNVEFLDLRNALERREVCGRDTRQADEQNPADTVSEWARDISYFQGHIQEDAHPNAYGQAALGNCLQKMAVLSPGFYGCDNGGPGTSATAMTVRPIPPQARARR
ncbi:GDSL-type esterase/lipase family protein [Streptomyces rimosus]|uniref:GDSL-type esterase/lipase family protein n=1 Tax=Streptomyces rimosus TaxID=1927 RepID=UPI00067CB116|nr:GDSL-type esterase/lipase family protein [Streptomyces rimosus]